MAKRLTLTMGLKSVRVPQFASEPGYVDAVNAAVKALTNDILSVIDQFEEATPEIMLEALRPTFEKAKYYCPKLTHALVNSGYLEITGTKKAPRVEMGFAKGGEPRYGVIVHENLEFRHAAPTQAKFLERAVLEDLMSIEMSLGDAYGRFMSG